MPQFLHRLRRVRCSSAGSGTTGHAPRDLERNSEGIESARRAPICKVQCGVVRVICSIAYNTIPYLFLPSSTILFTPKPKQGNLRRPQYTPYLVSTRSRRLKLPQAPSSTQSQACRDTARRLRIVTRPRHGRRRRRRRSSGDHFRPQLLRAGAHLTDYALPVSVSSGTHYDAIRS